ncbi:hypothetical protein EF913_04910 [Streptomyces sp. WAC04189]|uniref:hypothetical protein n=1 Tax=unclassified Streptomyces TaxID=2593676 RepID=UPI000F9EF18F|nr:hypothetical protein [Streptomyces sp. WAC04189]RSS04197.1 hypothetical protein EF913_04910 [Streptomyces sp. WAC04189]
MASKTDNGVTPTLYRYYRGLQKSVAGTEQDLDRRFDRIIAGIEQRKWQEARGRDAKPSCLTCLRNAVHRARRSTFGQISAGGATAALAAKLTQYAQGWANLAAAAATGMLAAVVVAAAMDTRNLAPLRRVRRRRQTEDATPSPHP